MSAPSPESPGDEKQAAISKSEREEKEKQERLAKWGETRLNGPWDFVVGYVYPTVIYGGVFWFFASAFILIFLSKAWEYLLTGEYNTHDKISNTSLFILWPAGIATFAIIAFCHGWRTWKAREKEYMEVYPGAVVPRNSPRDAARWNESPWTGRRILALIADLAISFVACVLISLLPGIFKLFHEISHAMVGGYNSMDGGSKQGFACVFYIIFLGIPTWVQACIFLPLFRRTPGMWVFGLSIEHKDGRPLDAVEASSRFFATLLNIRADINLYGNKGNPASMEDEKDKQLDYQFTCSGKTHWISYLAAMLMAGCALSITLECLDKYERPRMIQPLFLGGTQQSWQPPVKKRWGDNPWEPKPGTYFSLLAGYLFFIGCTALSSRNLPASRSVAGPGTPS